MLKVTNLSKNFPNKKAVDSISFQVKPGVITGLLGPNGAGKTTTMRLLTGFLEASSGEIYYKDINLNTDSEIFKQKLGYLPETAALYPDMIIYEYLAYMADARGVKPEFKEDRIQEMIKICELESHLYTPIGFLSKGFKQRVALAGTLIHDPEVIILDEPTSGLDPNQISHIRNLIKSLGKQKTLILSTHILQEVEDICDEVIIINQGKIVANSSVKNLYSNHSVLITVNSNFEKINSIFKSDDFISIEEYKEEEIEWEGYYSYLIHLKSFQPDLVFKTLAKTDLNVLELRVYKKSLESIFEELTRKI